MASKVLEAELRLTARDATAAGLRSATGNIRSASSQMASLGMTAVKAFGAFATIDAAVRSLTAIATAAVDTDRDVRKIGITANASAEELAHMERVLSLAASGARTASRDMMSTVDAFVTAGIDLNTATASAPIVAKTAKAAAASIEDVNASAIALVNNMGISSGQLTHAMDMLVQGGKVGMFELKDMASQLPSLTASAAKLGMTGERGLAQIVAMAQIVRERTATGSEAATDLVDLFEKLTSPEVTKSLKKLGVDSKKIFERAKGDGIKFFNDMMQEINRVVAGDPYKLSQIFGNLQARVAAQAVLDDLGRVRDMTRQVGGAAGVMERDFRAAGQGASGAIDHITASWQTLVDTIARGKRNIVSQTVSTIADGLDVAQGVLSIQEIYDAEFEKLTGHGNVPGLGRQHTAAGVLARSQGMGVPPDRIEQALKDAAIQDAAASVITNGKLDQSKLDSLNAVGRAQNGRGFDFDALEHADRRLANLDRQYARFWSRGSGMSDSTISAEIAKRDVEGKRVQDQIDGFRSMVANNPALGAGVDDEVKLLEQQLAKIESERRQWQGFLDARAADAKAAANPAAGPTTVPLPTPRPKRKHEAPDLAPPAMPPSAQAVAPVPAARPAVAPPAMPAERPGGGPAPDVHSASDAIVAGLMDAAGRTKPPAADTRADLDRLMQMGGIGPSARGAPATAAELAATAKAQADQMATDALRKQIAALGPGDDLKRIALNAELAAKREQGGPASAQALSAASGTAADELSRTADEIRQSADALAAVVRQIEALRAEIQRIQAMDGGAKGMLLEGARAELDRAEARRRQLLASPPSVPEARAPRDDWIAREARRPRDDRVLPTPRTAAAVAGSPPPVDRRPIAITEARAPRDDAVGTAAAEIAAAVAAEVAKGRAPAPDVRLRSAPSPEDFERARRAQDYRDQQPEAARGDAMMRLPDPGLVRQAGADFGRLVGDAGHGLMEALRNPGTLIAQVRDPVKAVLEGRADLTVRIQAEPGTRVMQVSARSEGHIRTNVGTSMPELPRGHGGHATE